MARRKINNGDDVATDESGAVETASEENSQPSDPANVSVADATQPAVVESPAASGGQAPKAKIEFWAEQCVTPAWLLAATKRHQRWGAGYECTRAVFEAATKDVGRSPIARSRAPRKPIQK